MNNTHTEILKSATSRAPVRVMAHLVAGYPSDSLAFAAARGLADGGVSYFEIQLPFSDPSADGRAIQTACAEVLSRGYKVEKGFRFVSKLRQLYPEIPVFIMTYGNLAFRPGIETFVRQAADAGASGLIIPDLPFDSDEGLSEICFKNGLVSVPVAAPSMTNERIITLSGYGYQYIYAALRSGITGTQTSIDVRTLEFLKVLGTFGARILGGFGIRNGEQAAVLVPVVHAVVAGSVFVDCIRTNAPDGESAVYTGILALANTILYNTNKEAAIQSN